MSVQGTRIKDRESLFFGLAELYLGDSESNEASNTAVLGEDDYFSCMAEISFNISKKFSKRYDVQNGVKILENIFLISSNFEVEASFVELTEKNLSLALGGDGTETNILDNLIKAPTALRAEIIFSYPNGTNTLTLILPKVNVITNSVGFDFLPEEAMQVPLKLAPLKCTHSSWSSNPLGKIIFA